MEEFEARTAQKHQIHKQLLSGQLAAIEEMSHKQRQQQQQQEDDSDAKSSNTQQSFQMEKRDSNALASQFFESGYDTVASSPSAYKGGSNSIDFKISGQNWGQLSGHLFEPTVCSLYI